MTITKEQAQTRFKTLAPVLRSAIFSVQTAESVARIVEQNTLPKEKAAQMAEVAGLVLLGFLRAEDVAPEIQSRLGVSGQSTRSIADALNSKIFSPLKVEIDRAYEPLADGTKKPTPLTELPQKPSIVDEIKRLEKSGEELIGVLKKMEPPGTSFRPSNPPSNQLVPRAPSAPLSSPGLPVAPVALPPKPKEAPLSSFGGPVILHQESEASPLLSRSGFKLDIPLRNFSDRGVTSEPVQKMARLEVGGVQKPPSESQARTSVAGPERSINYELGSNQRPGGPPLPPPLAVRPTGGPLPRPSLGGLPTSLPKPPVLPQRPEPSPLGPPRLQARPEPIPANLPPIPDKKYQDVFPREEKSSPFRWFKSLFGTKPRPAPSEVRVVNLSAEDKPALALKIDPPKPRDQGLPPTPTPPRLPAPPPLSPLIPNQKSNSPTVDIKPKAPTQGLNQNEEVIDLSSLTKIRR